MDPGHVRAIGPEMLTFLVQPEYTRQVGISPMTDYRFIYKADFDVFHAHVDEATKQFYYILRAVKPSRIAE